MGSRRVLITGITGLLGSRVAMLHLQAGDQVHGVVREKPVNPIPGVTYHLLDLSSNWNPANVHVDPDVVIHLAQSDRFRDFPLGAMDVFSVNVNSTMNLLELAKEKGSKVFILSSSGGVYGPSAAPLQENSSLAQSEELGFYLASKSAAEMLSQAHSSLLNIIILRPFYIFGLGQRRSMLLPRLFDAVESAKEIYVDGSNGLIINPIHVDDAALAVVKSTYIDESITINIAGPDPLSIREIVESIGEFIGLEPVIRTTPNIKTDSVADISLMEQRLGPPVKRFIDHIGDLRPIN